MMTPTEPCENDNEYEHCRSALFPKHVHYFIIPIQDIDYAIPRQELELVKTATKKRISEFSAGRYCAHKLLCKLGMDDGPILIGKNREPLWPPNILGAITHCKDLAGAAICTNGNLLSIGFDIENRKSLKNPIEKYICTKQEIEWLNSQNNADVPTLTLLLFSIKESLDKCLFQANGYRLNFKDVQVFPDLKENVAEVTILNKEVHLKQTEVLKVRFHISGQHIFSSAVLEKSPELQF